MPVNKIIVLDQTKAVGGEESCGYHVFKNVLLTLMLKQNIITESKFNSMLKDVALFTDIYNKTLYTRISGLTGLVTHDLSVPLIIDLLKKVKAGEFDFSAHGISKNDLANLNVELVGSPNVSVVSYILDPNAPEHGLGGDEPDLSAAASAAQFARNKGKGSHVFAVGLVNPHGISHWVTAIVTQDAKGIRTWEHMDSYVNQSLYLNTPSGKIERILKKSEEELKAYLVEAYDENSQTGLMNRRYNSFFDAKTGLAKKEKDYGWGLKENESWDATDYFVKDKKNLETFSDFIVTRAEFMETAGWLPALENQKNGLVDGRATAIEKQRVSQLYSLTKFMYENADKNDLAVKEVLKPICEKLKSALGKDDILENIHDKAKAPEALVDVPAAIIPDVPVEVQAKKTEIPVDVQAEKTEVPVDVHAEKTEVPSDFQAKKNTGPTVEPEVDQQAKAAHFAAEQGEPKPTEGFSGGFVKAIKALWEGIKSAVEYVARSIGLVS